MTDIAQATERAVPNGAPAPSGTNDRLAYAYWKMLSRDAREELMRAKSARLQTDGFRPPELVAFMHGHVKESGKTVPPNDDVGSTIVEEERAGAIALALLQDQSGFATWIQHD